MRPQARQFSVEIKSRKRPTSPAIAASAAARQDDWVDLIPPDDVPERDVHEDLADPSVQSEARREAERLFGRLGDAQPIETRKDATSTVPPEPAPAPARVLPDLIAAAREEERTMIEKPKRTRAPKSATKLPKVTRPKKPKSAKRPVEQAQPAPSPSAASSPAPTVHAQAAAFKSRRSLGGSKSLPRGQRWKERRLPRVCWDR
ncbi:MAG: hypothetical protein K0R61_1007 [Microvirga sp.]|jgi:hypothetical protein|nr:hypothetical protein [Microvirga sp.]